MVRQCERCQYNIDQSYLLKQDRFDEIICPNCGRKLVVTDLSKIVTLCFIIMFFVIIIILPIKVITIVFIETLWIIFSKSYLPAFLYIYKEKEKEDL